MKLSFKQIGVIIFLLNLFLMPAMALAEDAAQILRQAEQAKSLEEIRVAMAKLATIDSEQSAQYFAKIFEDKLIPLKLRLHPFLDPMYKFEATSKNMSAFLPILKEVEKNELDPATYVYLTGLFARFGETKRISWLINEYRVASKSITKLGYPALILKVLCEINNDEASNFVVELVLQSTDPTIKLTAVDYMLVVGNPRAIEIMRRWPSVESGDFDLIIAKYYLMAIKDFGDERDLAFLDWLDQNAQTYFPVESIEGFLNPLPSEARANIVAKAKQLHVDPLGGDAGLGSGFAHMTWGIGFLLLGLLVFFAYRKRSHSHQINRWR